MQKNDFYNDDFNFDEESVPLREQLAKYSRHYKWIILSALLGLIGAFIYLKRATPMYKASTSILVKDEKKGGMLSELSAFSDLGIGGGMSNVDNEIEILRSRTLVEKTVNALGLTQRWSLLGGVRPIELYLDAPLKVLFENPNANTGEDPIVLEFELLEGNAFEMELPEYDQTLTGRLGEKLKTPYGNVVVVSAHGSEKEYYEPGVRLKYTWLHFDDAVKEYQERLAIESISKTSSVVTLSYTGPIVERAELFLNTLVKLYNQDAADDKNVISENTSKFINNRLKLLTKELEGVEQDVESFKRVNQLTDIETEAQQFITGSTEYSKKAVEAEIQLNVVRSLLEYLKKGASTDLIPANLLSGGGESASLINEYNTLVLNRNRVLKSATTENPAVVQLDGQIKALKANIASSLHRMESNLNIQKRDLSSQEGQLKEKITKIPTQERQFKVIARQQKVKEELYLYLLQKREETAISLAATEPNARVIDAAKADIIPVAPKGKIVLLGGLLLGLLIPVGIIYGADLLDNKIHSRLDLEGKTQIPFVGDIPTSDSPDVLMKSDSRSSAAEAVRIVRTNLEFMLNQVPNGKAKTVFFTSTLANEGKSFVSANLAATTALTGKKVLLIGADLRNPTLGKFFELPAKGLTSYLASQEGTVDSFIVKNINGTKLDVLPAGVIPPNPSELLMGAKVKEMFDYLKQQYDYIIVDTAPISLVTDSLLIADQADCFVYVMRANVFEKRMIHIPNQFYKERKLPNMALLLNDTDSTKGYGYGYGYGFGTPTKKKWYQF